MDVISQGPLRTSSLVWLPRTGQWTLTVVCKATFDLRPGDCALAAEQDAVNEEDNHWNDDPTRSLYSPADLVPYKPRADVLLVGSAFAPHGQPVPSLIARLVVGTINKTIDVHGDRAFGPDGQARDRVPFVKMPLRYERTAGGPDTWNPVGVRLTGSAGALVLPNLLPPGASLTRRGEIVAPIGFGPVAPTWPERRARLGKYDGIWPQPGWTERPFPKEIDAGYYNVAPADQQLDTLRDDERLVLENLHPEHPRLVTRLPGLRPKALVERRGAPQADRPMTPDTLWIDTDRGVCTVTWRAHVQLADRTEWGRITIVGGGRDRDAPASSHDTAVLGNVMAVVAAGLSATKTAELEEVSIDEELTGAHGDGVDGAVQTMFLGPSVMPTKAVLPFAASAPVQQPTPVQPPASVQPPEPPALRVPPGERLEAASSSPWAAPSAEARPRLSIGEQAAIPPPQPVVRAPSGAGIGVMDASNAAAGAAAVAPVNEAPAQPPAVEARPRVKPREVIKLLWFDPKSLPRIRKHPEWRVVLAELELRLLEEGELDEEDAGEASFDEPKPKDRRDVFEVLAKGRSIGAEGVRLALDEAIGEDGKFEPPLVLLAGELEFPFDEVATLKATAAAAAPFAMGDPKLKEQLDVVEELQKTPWLQGSGSIAEGLTEKIKAVFGAQKRGVDPGYLTSHTDRMLLEQRCYQMRTVFGKRWIRSVLGASGVPVYVPEALKDELPMYRRVKVRAVGEVDMQEDQFEGGAAAVKVVALGRVMG